jgi:hypothetical protein
MRSLAVLCLLGACGDNVAPVTYDSAFESDQLRAFGEVRLFTGPNMSEAVSGADACFDDTCTTSAADGSFVVTGEGGAHEAVFTARHSPNITTITGLIAGPIGDRNLSAVPLLADELLAGSAEIFGRELALADHGLILVIAVRYDAGTIELAVDGSAAGYFDDALQPDPTRTSMSRSGGVLFFGVAPGEAVLRSVKGECAVSLDGWPGAERGQIRLPVQAGAITFVRPFCVGE